MNPFIEKILLQESERILTYEFITIKPLGKSPNGLLINQAIALGLESGLVKVYDLFGNALMEFLVGEVKARAQPSQTTLEASPSFNFSSNCQGDISESCSIPEPPPSSQ